MATPAPNPRASLLAGLRTGGVRSASGPVPHTAAPTTRSFNIPHITVNEGQDYYPPEEEDLSNMMSQNLYIRNGRSHQGPVTSALDGRFQHRQGNDGVPAGMTPQQQLQQLQLQVMQMEMVRMQALQAQQYQYQAELLAAQAQAAQHQQSRRAASYVVPSTAGPTNTSFDLRAAMMRRANQADFQPQFGVVDDHVPMTAALNGKFGSRIIPGGFDYDDFSSRAPTAPSYTTVISGGTSLGAPATPNFPSKSDTAVSWRRAGSNSVLANRAVTFPTVKITPPPSERESPPPGLPGGKMRPTPLRFTAETSQPVVAAIAFDNDGPDADDSSTSSKSNSSPSTPHSADSGDVPLSPREEATKKLYEGLGVGRPAPGINVVVSQDSQMVVQRLVSTPVRQPRGPPSNNEELVPKNFATRTRRKAIDALLGHARERQEVVDAY